MRIRSLVGAAALAAVAAACVIDAVTSVNDATPAVDEAMRAGKQASDYPEAAVDAFRDMDGGIELTSDEFKGRNTWLMWTGGNEAFWDYLATHSYGLTDLLRVVVDKRADRFVRYGLVNEPGFEQTGQVDRYGLPIDRHKGANTELWNPDGVDPNVYGYSSGVVGFRLYPNPAFDAEAAKRWDAKRYLDPNDREYHERRDIVRPYRVGMACAACHVSHHPQHPAQDPAEPEWANLSSTIGQPWLKSGQLFGPLLKSDHFVFQLLDQTPPGTLDTSLISTDGNNNPNTMNPIWQVAERLRIGVPERIGEAARALPDQLDEQGMRATPHVLADGADSIGIKGALARVYVNIGEFHQEWLRHHNLLVGMRPQTPIPIASARERSVYWQVSEQRVQNLARFFVKAATRMPLEKAPGGREFMVQDAAQLERGKRVFARQCFACHSSKQPVSAAKDPLDRLRDPAYVQWAESEVMKPDFLESNYLSTDERIPVRVVQTNAGRALADNATRGHIWDNFSSETYKSLPSGGPIKVWDPFTKKEFEFETPSGGPGYYRVPPLVGIWATAPFLHNNGIGTFSGNPSVAGRVAAFEDAVEKLLWPERRPSQYRYLESEGRWVPTDLRAAVWKTAEPSSLRIPAAYVPDLLQGLIGYRSMLILGTPWLLPLLALLAAAGVLAVGIQKKLPGLRVGGAAGFAVAIALSMATYFAAGERGDLDIGPIPTGTPVNLLANIDVNRGDKAELVRTVLQAKKLLVAMKAENVVGSAAVDRLAQEVGSQLLRFSKSPDLIEDRGHWFGTRLPDEDKRALIAFMKTF